MRSSLLLLVLRRSGRLRTFISSCLLASMLLLPLRAASPDWWTRQNVLRSGTSADDYAAINQGQLKNLAAGAVAEMDASWPQEGAGYDLQDLVQKWLTPTNQTDDYAAVTLGQLKAVSAPVYDRLISVGLATAYPWNTANTPAPDDYALANIGQAKALFAFDLNGTLTHHLPASWLARYPMSGTGTGPDDDFDGDGLTNYQEFLMGISPNKADTDGDGVPDGEERALGTSPLDATSHPPYYIPEGLGWFTYLPDNYLATFVGADGAYSQNLLPGVYLGIHEHYDAFYGTSTYSVDNGVSNSGITFFHDVSTWFRNVPSSSALLDDPSSLASGLLADSTRYANETWRASGWSGRTASLVTWGSFTISVGNRSFDYAGGFDSEERLQSTNPVGDDVTRTYLVVDEIEEDYPSTIVLNWYNSDDVPSYKGVAATEGTWGSVGYDSSLGQYIRVKTSTAITREIKGTVTMTIPKGHYLTQSIQVTRAEGVPASALSARSGADPRYHPLAEDGTLSTVSEYYEALYFAPPVPQKNKNIRRKLVSMEIVDRNEQAVRELKIGKMSESGVLSGTGTLDIDSDPDRFYIRIEGGKKLGDAAVSISTVENPDSSYDDGPTKIDLLPQGDDLISKSLLLVSDEVDDKFKVDGVKDNAKNDRTQRIQLGGKLKFNGIHIGTNSEQTVDIKVPVQIKKTVKVKMVNCIYGVYGLRSPCWPSSGVDLIKQTLKERYAQIGVKLEILDMPGPWIGITGYVDGYPKLIGGVMDIPTETKNIFAAVPASSSDEIVLYLIRRMSGAGAPAGVSTVPKYMTTSDKADGYGNKALLSGLNGTIFTPSHEILHILLDAVHQDPSPMDFPTEFADKQMLWHTETTDNQKIDDTKRISVEQEKKIYLSPFAK